MSQPCEAYPAVATARARRAEPCMSSAPLRYGPAPEDPPRRLAVVAACRGPRRAACSPREGLSPWRVDPGAVSGT
eukprot:2601645-Pyramimonas_sp.AAC.1